MVVWMCSSGVEARETAVQGVVAAMPEAMRFSGEGLEVATGHVDDEGGFVGQGAGTAWCERELSSGVVRGREDELRGAGAIRERRLEAGGYGEGGGDSGDDLEGDCVLAEEADLLGGSPEDQRVAGFEADD